MSDGPCAKAVVRCTIVTTDRRRYYGSNHCFNAQPHCPRQPGEGYEKCRWICAQPAHAEIAALWSAMENGAHLDGATAYVTGINRICDDCRDAMTYWGIKPVLGAPPP